MQIRFVATAALAALCGAVASADAAAAEDAKAFPNKPLRILVGPGPDIVGRLIGQKFTEAWGQQTVVDQRPGGGGVISAELAAKAPAARKWARRAGMSVRRSRRGGTRIVTTSRR